MELLQLKYFKTVAEHGKIVDAAQALFLSPPALSTSISRLEKELGVRLFDRVGNRITLNAQGRTFLRYVNRVFSELDSARTELMQSALREGQHISIGCVASTQWVDMITAFSQEYPRFTLLCTGLRRIELATTGLPPQVSFLLASEEDIPPSFGKDLDSVFLFEDHPMVMIHPDHPIAREKSVDLSALQGETIFLPFQHFPLYDHLVKLFQDAALPFPAGNAYSHLATQQMVAAGLGVAFATRHSAHTSGLDVRYIPIRNEYRPWACCLYWRKDRTLTEAEALFQSFIITYYQSSD